MTDNLKNFLKKADSDEEISKKFKTLQDEKDREVVIQKTIDIAKEAGIELSEADFDESASEMSDEELIAIAGGWKNCFCSIGGGGKADEDGETCVCVAAGYGKRRRDGGRRCICVLGGAGEEIL